MKDESMKTVLLNAAVGALFSLVGVVIGASLSEHLAAERQLRQFQVEAFQQYEQEFLFRDAELRRLRMKFESKKKNPLTDDEREYYLGFFEDVGGFSRRGLIDFDLLDNSLGPYIVEAYEDRPTMKWVRQSRLDDNEPRDYENFESLAIKLEAYDAATRQARARP